jgi:hypothetical protein
MCTHFHNHIGPGVAWQSPIISCRSLRWVKRLQPLWIAKTFKVRSSGQVGNACKHKYVASGVHFSRYKLSFALRAIAQRTLKRHCLKMGCIFLLAVLEITVFFILKHSCTTKSLKDLVLCLPLHSLVPLIAFKNWTLSDNCSLRPPVGQSVHPICPYCHSQPFTYKCKSPFSFLPLSFVTCCSVFANFFFAGGKQDQDGHAALLHRWQLLQCLRDVLIVKKGKDLGLLSSLYFCWGNSELSSNPNLATISIFAEVTRNCNLILT